MTHWTNKKLFITGAGSGIGRALAQHFAALNAKLILTDLNEDQLKETICTVEDNVELYEVADVSDTDCWQNLVKKIDNQIGHLDVLINNAGMSSFGFFDETPAALFDQVMAVNFQGVVNGCRYCMPLLEKSSNAMIVNVASVFGLISAPMLTPYHSSKFAVKGFSEALKQDLKYQGKNIDVICVLPGGIKTNIANHAITANNLKKEMAVLFDSAALTTAEKAANIIERGMRRKRTRLLVGPDAKLVDWISRWAPNSYFHLTNRLLGIHRFLMRNS